MRVKALVVFSAVLFLGTLPATAQLHSGGLAISGLSPESVATPEARAASWLGAFDEFLATYPGLSADQMAAVSEAVGLADPGLFSDRPSPEAKATIVRAMATLQEALPCGAFADLLSEFDGLRGWLEANQIVAAGTCTCNSDAQCASGWSCVSTSCTSDAGSTNWGTCGKGGVEIE